MSIKSGYGTIIDVLDDTANTNLIIQLPSKQTKRILNVDCGYSLVIGGANTALFRGRLLVVGTKYENDTEFVNPSSITYPTGLQGTQIYFDCPISGNNNVTSISRSFSWTQGILIPDGVDASIILTACFGNGAVPPLAISTNAFLNVQGLTGGSDKIFKNL